MSFFARSPETRTAVIFDIGSASIGACITIAETTDKAPRIIYTTRTELAFPAEQHIDKLLLNTYNAVFETALTLQKEGLPILKRLTRSEVIHYVHCIYSAPWTLPQSKILEVAKDRPFVVTEDRVNLLMAKAEEKFMEEQRSSKEFVHESDDTEIIESHVTNIVLNGYHSENPYGNSTTKLHVGVFMSIIATEFRYKIEKTIRKVFPNPELSHNSFTLAYFTVMRDLLLRTPSYLLVDVAGEVTELSVVREGILLKSQTVPSGKRPFIRHIAEDMRSTPRVAESSLRLAKDGIRSKSNIEKPVKKASAAFSETCSQAIAALADEYPLPHDVFITADEDAAHHFEECIKDAFALMHHDALLRTHVVDRAVLAPVAHYGEGAANDVFLTIGARFFHKTINTT